MDSDVEEDDDDDTAQVDPEFRRKVAEALQVAGMANGEDVEEDVDEDDVDSDSDDVSISMDDDQMLQLDEKLGEIFKQQKEGKGTATCECRGHLLSQHGTDKRPSHSICTGLDPLQSPCARPGRGVHEASTSERASTSSDPHPPPAQSRNWY